MIVELFESYLGFECPKNTRRAYLCCFNEWLKFTELRGIDPLTATEKDAQAYVADIYDGRLKTGKISRHTLRTKIQFLFYFWNYLKSRGQISTNIFAESYIRFKRFRGGDRREYKAIGDENVNRMFACSDSQMKAILALLFGGALRRSEVLSINLADVIPTSVGAVEIRLRKTKSGRVQSQPIPEWASGHIKKHVRSRRVDRAGDDDPLFISSWHRRMSDRTLARHFKDICDALGIEAFTSHSGRVTALTKLRRNGGDLRSIQAFARHSTLQMAAKYLRTNDAEDAKELISY